MITSLLTIAKEEMKDGDFILWSKCDASLRDTLDELVEFSYLVRQFIYMKEHKGYKLQYFWDKAFLEAQNADSAR